MDETEAKEAAIIRRVYQGGYSHAENVLLRLNELSASLPHAEAVDVLYDEVVLSGSDGEVIPDDPTHL